MDVVEKAKEQLKKNSESLHIDRLPTPIKREFKKFALDEFSDDYGMTLKHVWEEWKLLRQVFDTVIINHEERIQALEGIPAEAKKKTVRNILGKELKTGRGGIDEQNDDGQVAETADV